MALTRDTNTTYGGASPVAGLLLAGGGGRRLGGRPKALLEHRGRTLVEHAAAALAAGGCGPVHVVTGAAAADVRARLDGSACVVVENPGWAGGMGSSLRAGLASLAGAEVSGAEVSGAEVSAVVVSAVVVSAVVVTLVDQPRIGAAAVARVVAAHRAGAGLVAAAYGGRRGHPVLLAREHWAGVAREATGDRGARAYLRAHADAVRLVECADIAAPDDVDTPDDLALLA
ncbi:NTP transferase domain-containing protein [Streptomyces sp. I05A-00742]|uniref:nucleotidyltransferase family protein n=1 Tax=Streptomyces sp. I05A-00742 TaxID=2732853 RepID=UPI001489C040|nr:nucleotidyltransferase family protein [Streptomyces sp. I05A-00742]